MTSINLPEEITIQDLSGFYKIRNILKIKPLNREVEEIYNKARLQFHVGDAGFDLVVPRNYNSSDLLHQRNPEYPGYENNYQLCIDFEISCELLREINGQTKNASYMLVPRSSIVKSPFRQANSVGIIDAGYRGSIKAVVDVDKNYAEWCIAQKQSLLTKGTRLFQLIRGDLDSINEVQIVSELSETSRGSGGFGSTGAK
jgi:dUTP pyrophosphatase